MIVVENGLEIEAGNKPERAGMALIGASLRCSPGQTQWHIWPENDGVTGAGMRLSRDCRNPVVRSVALRGHSLVTITRLRTPPAAGAFRNSTAEPQPLMLPLVVKWVVQACDAVLV